MCQVCVELKFHLLVQRGLQMQRFVWHQELSGSLCRGLRTRFLRRVLHLPDHQTNRVSTSTTTRHINPSVLSGWYWRQSIYLFYNHEIFKLSLDIWSDLDNCGWLSVNSQWFVCHRKLLMHNSFSIIHNSSCVQGLTVTRTLLPFMDLFVHIFCTECFHLKVNTTGLKKNERQNQKDNNFLSHHLNPVDDMISTAQTAVFTFPVSSGPGCRVTEQGRFRGI